MQAAQANIQAPLWTKNFIGTSLANLFLFLSFQMLLPTLPAYVSARGGDEFAVGLVLGIFTISALISRPFTGRALDTIGRRNVLLVGLVIFILSVAGYYWLGLVSLILLLRVIHGVGWGITTTAFGTVIADIVPPQRRGEGMGYYGLSANLPMALAPIFGIWLMNEYGFGILFTVSAVLAIIALLLSQTMIRFPKVESAGPSGAKQGLLEKSAYFPSLLVIFLAVSYGGIVSFITLFGKEVGIANVGWFFLANGAMVMLVRPFAGILFDRKGHAAVLIPGMIACAIGLVLLSYTTDLTLLMVSAVFFGAGFGSMHSALQAWTINRVPANRRGVANGTYFSAFDLGIGAGSMLLGTLAKLTSYAMIYRSTAVLMVICLAVYLYYLITKQEKTA